MGLACMTAAGFEAAIFYLAAYYFMNLGAFGFLLYFQGVTGEETVESLRGMGWKAPLVSITMVVFLVSLTGLPPTIGFFGKYLLFVEGVHADLTWLVVVAAINSVISLFYYFRVVKALFLSSPAEETPRPQPWFAGLLAAFGVLTIVGGVWNAPLQEWSAAGQKSLGLEQAVEEE
jgi:NADH-quinone oxidoreductase subunit N